MLTDRRAIPLSEILPVLAEHAPDVGLVVESDGTVMTAFGATEALLGYPPDALAGLPVERFVPVGKRLDHHEHRARFSEHPKQRPMGEGQPLEAVHRDGRHMPVSIQLSPFQWRGESLVLCVLRDISSEVAAERASKEAQNRYERLFHNSPDAIVEIGLDGRIRDANPATHELLGHEPDALIGMPMQSLLESGDAWTEVTDALRDSDSVAGHEVVVRHGDGTTRTCILSAVIRTSATDDLLGYQGILVDVSRRANMEERLREREAQFRKAEEVGQIGSWQWTTDVRAFRCTPGMHRVLGVDPERFSGGFRRFLALIPEADRENMRAEFRSLMREGSTLGLEHRIVDAAGNVRWVSHRVEVERDQRGHVKLMTGILMDITERRTLQDHLLQVQRLEAVGELAGGIAHEFNNLLTVIQNNLELLNSSGGTREERNESFQDIASAAERARMLTRHVLSFAQRQITQPRPLDLAGEVEAAKDLLAPLVGNDITMQLTVDPALPRVRMDPGQVEQVVTNLVLNARDAIDDSGQIHLDLARVEARAAPELEKAMHGPPATTDDDGEGSARAFVKLSVRDTGRGMSLELRQRAFEPFFTTKRGTGAGLGLAAVHGIVTQNRGRIQLESDPGRGTTVTVLFPVAE